MTRYPRGVGDRGRPGHCCSAFSAVVGIVRMAIPLGLPGGAVRMIPLRQAWRRDFIALASPLFDG